MIRLARSCLRTLATLAVALAPLARADTAPVQKPVSEPYPVVYRGVELFRLSCSLGSYPVSDRANGVRARLDEIARDASFDAGKITTGDVDIGTAIFAGARPLMTVTDCDATAEGVSRAALAGRWAGTDARGSREAAP